MTTGPSRLRCFSLVNQVWPGDYDREKTQAALEKTIQVTAYDGPVLVGCLRILTDGCFFGTITELLVLPSYQKQGIGSHLLQLARERTPTMLYFGAQPGLEPFYEIQPTVLFVCMSNIFGLWS